MWEMLYDLLSRVMSFSAGDGALIRPALLESQLGSKLNEGRDYSLIFASGLKISGSGSFMVLKFLMTATRSYVADYKVSSCYTGRCESDAASTLSTLPRWIGRVFAESGDEPEDDGQRNSNCANQTKPPMRAGRVYVFYENMTSFVSGPLSTSEP